MNKLKYYFQKLIWPSEQEVIIILSFVSIIEVIEKELLEWLIAFFLLTIFISLFFNEHSNKLLLINNIFSLDNINILYTPNSFLK